jgi:hypothetical protein
VFVLDSTVNGICRERVISAIYANRRKYCDIIFQVAGSVDSFPAGDLGVIKALTKKGRAPSKKEIKEMAEQWRPYRSYAALCLWNYGSERDD